MFRIFNPWTRFSIGKLVSKGRGLAFTPAPLFASGEQGAWYDPSDLTTLFQDSAGTIPVTADGDPVGLMLDKSGNGNHATQSTSARRPVYRTDGTLHWLEFDGVDDSLLMGTFSLPSELHQCLGYDTNGDATGIFWSRGDNSNGSWTHVFDAGSATTILTDFTSFNSLYVNGVSQTFANRGDIYTAINGKKVSVWNTTTSNETYNWYFGEYFAATFNLSGHLYGMVWRDRLTKTERENVENYLADRTGITL